MEGNVLDSFPPKEKSEQNIVGSRYGRYGTTLVWVVPLSMYICPRGSCMCVFGVCAVMKVRKGNKCGNTEPDQLQASRTGSGASENRKRQCG